MKKASGMEMDPSNFNFQPSVPTHFTWSPAFIYTQSLLASFPHCILALTFICCLI